jgi:hypothetical protein
MLSNRQIHFSWRINARLLVFSWRVFEYRPVSVFKIVIETYFFRIRYKYVDGNSTSWS